MLELFEINCGVCHGIALRIRESWGLIVVVMVEALRYTRKPQGHGFDS
jgi:hypothetical protein